LEVNKYSTVFGDKKNKPTSGMAVVGIKIEFLFLFSIHVKRLRMKMKTEKVF
jgi:glutamate formiminotransferase